MKKPKEKAVVRCLSPSDRMKLDNFINLFDEPKPEKSEWRLDLKKSMANVQSVMNRILNSERLTVEQKRAIKKQASVFQAMIARIVKGDTWVVVLHHMREDPIERL